MYGVIEENPYKLAEDIQGVGFKIADEIASNIGIQIDSDYRIYGGILCTLREAMGEGHVYLPKEKLIKVAANLLELEEMAIEPALPNLAMEKRIVMIILGEMLMKTKK